MATITIENAEVTSTMRGGIGFRAQTQYKTRGGDMIPEKWVIWTKDPVNVGDVVNITGLFSKKDESFTNDKGELVKYTAIHVNNAQISASPMPIKQAMEDVAKDVWLERNAKPIQDDGQIPF